jgi:dTDP-4-dehydrorhamnose 3,5-epimerase
MIFNKEMIEGIYTLEPTVLEDNRGHFFRTFCMEEMEVFFQKPFVQMNQSFNKKAGTFRGFHYQKPPFEEGKLIRCINGSVQDIVIDVRENSKTFLQSFSVILSRENKKMIYIPEGCAHGFVTLEDNTELVYQHTNYYNKDADAGINVKDEAIKVTLQTEIEIISEKDKSIKLLDKNFKGI